MFEPLDGDIPTGKEVRKRLSLQLGSQPAAEAPRPQLRSRAFTTMFAAGLDQDNKYHTKTEVAAFLRFRAPLELALMRSLLHERLCEIPRFRSRVVPGPTGGWSKSFQQLTDAELAKALEVLVTERADIKTDEDVDRLCSEFYGRQEAQLDLPLWRAFVHNHMADGKSQLTMMINHAIGDGVALIQVLMSMLDEKPETPVPVRREATAVRWKTYARGLAAACWGPFVGDQLPADPPNKLKSRDPLNPGRKKALKQTPQISLEKIKEVKSKIPGASVNDVLMTLVAMTLQDYFRQHDPKALKQKVRGNFPINLRHATGSQILDESQMGNRFSQGQLRFPLHLEDPMKIFADMKQQIDIIKVSPEPLVRDKLLSFLVLRSGFSKDRVAMEVLKAFGKVTAMLSNVPGPLQTVSFGGQEVDDLRFYALAPIGLYFGVIQYNGQLRAGIVCDAEAEPEPSKLADCWLPAFERLHAAAHAAHGGGH